MRFASFGNREPWQWEPSSMFLMTSDGIVLFSVPASSATLRCRLLSLTS